MDTEFDIVQASGGESDESDLPSECAEEPAQRKRKRVRRIVSHALTLTCALLVSTGTGCRIQTILDIHAGSARTGPDISGAGVAIIGVVFFTWHLAKASEAIIDETVACLWRTVQMKRRRTDLAGYCAYRAVHAHGLDSGFHRIDPEEAKSPYMFGAAWLHSLRTQTFGGRRIDELCAEYKATLPTSAFVLTHQLAEVIRDRDATAIDVVGIGKYIMRNTLYPGSPKKHQVAQWLKKPADPILTVPPDNMATLCNDIRYTVPSGTPDMQQSRIIGGGLGKAHDAVQIIRCLNFSKHLRDVGVTETALGDALECAVPDDTLREQLNANRPSNQKRTQIQKSRQKVDSVAMAIDRREFQSIIRTRSDELDSAHCYSDGSPVTGKELQGMVVDLVNLAGNVVRYILPGVMLHFGGTALIDKVLAFVWAIILVVGTNLNDLKFFFSRVYSFTTDMGTELGIPSFFNIAVAYLRRLQGMSLESAANLIDINSRLLPCCLQITGWGHLFGNLMKSYVKRHPRWPQFETHLRNMCKFFRNETYRLHLARVLPAAKAALERFKASLAKWRYETAAVVFEAIDKLREVITNCLQNIVDIISCAM